jgi:hypothetical protein
MGTMICVTPAVDRDNCGECGNQCGNHADCVNGECICVAGFTDCYGECVNLNFDAKHCGDCDNACPDGVACQMGTCYTGG